MPALRLQIFPIMEACQAHLHRPKARGLTPHAVSSLWTTMETGVCKQRQNVRRQCSPPLRQIPGGHTYPLRGPSIFSQPLFPPPLPPKGRDPNRATYMWRTITSVCDGSMSDTQTLLVHARLIPMLERVRQQARITLRLLKFNIL